MNLHQMRRVFIFGFVIGLKLYSDTKKTERQTAAVNPTGGLKNRGITEIGGGGGGFISGI